jgi:hypothetical protein
MDDDELAPPGDYGELVREFVLIRQWCRKALKEAFPDLLEVQLATLTRNFSAGLYFAQDVKNATEFVEKFRPIMFAAEDEKARLREEKCLLK